MAQQQAVRDYLRSRGLKDEEIGYDNGTVLAKGKRFMDATPGADGRTYADSKTLESAYNNYDTANQIADLRTRAQTPNAELTSMQQTIRGRINKPAQQFSYDQSSEPQYQNAIKRASQNAQTAGNNAMVSLGARGIGNSSITGDRVAQIQQRELGNVETTIAPQLRQQAYQEYLNRNQMENQQLGNMMQYANTMNNQDQQQYANLSNVLGLQNNFNQQQFTNEQAMTQQQRQAQQDHLALAAQLSQQFGVNVDPKDDPALAYEQVKGLTPLAMKQYLQQKEAQDAGFTGQYNGQPTMQKAAQDAGFTGVFNGAPTLQARQQDTQNGFERQRIGLSAGSQGQSASNARVNQLLDIYRATGQAPSGLEGYGVQPGTSYYNPSNPQNALKVDNKTSADNYSKTIDYFGKEKGLSSAEAKQILQNNVSELSDADYKRAYDWIDKNL